jgi:hypothetical protein
MEMGLWMLFVGNPRRLDPVLFRTREHAFATSFTVARAKPFGLTDVGGIAKPNLSRIPMGMGTWTAFVGNGYGNTQFFRNTGTASAPQLLIADVDPFATDRMWGIMLHPPLRISMGMGT